MNYRYVKAPEWFTGRTHHGRIHEHIAVCCQKYGLTEIPSGFQVHHIDHNACNNDPSNLVMLTAQEHQRIHHFGMHQSESTKDKIRAANTGRKVKDETKERLKIACGKRVKCIETGQVFVSAVAASEYLGRCRGAVGEAIRINGTCRGLHFVKLD